MTFVDHFLFSVLLILMPIAGGRNYRAFVRAVKAGADPQRSRRYRETILVQWVTFAILMGYWMTMKRPLDGLGFLMPSGAALWGGLFALLALTIVLSVSWYGARRMSPEKRSRHREQLGDLVYFLPHSEREYRGIVGVSFTAGIVEEVIYRGFLFWYLAHWLPLWAVIPVSSLVFGLCHSYQGVAGVMRVFAVGVGFGLFYALTGSVWLAMLGHIIFDVVQGRTLFEVLRTTPGPPPESEPGQTQAPEAVVRD